MDLSSAIENFSEYFVAANTRTTLTDFAESTSSNSMDPIHIGPNGNSSSNIMSTSHNNLSSQLGLAFGLSGSSPNGSMHKQLTSASLSQSNSIQNQVPSDDNHYDFDLECNNNNNNNSTTSHSSNHINNNTDHHQHQRDRLNFSRNNLKSEPFIQSSSSRLSQPTRAQIPIHCLIEQFDNYANISSYQPTLNDNDLFRTEDPTDLSDLRMMSQDHASISSHSNNNNNNHGNSNISSLLHLNQSKLALESVTNGSPLSTSIPTSNTSLFSTSNNPTDSSIFDTNLDHLGPDSPLSIHPDQNPSPTFGNADLQPTSILNSPTNIRQDSYLDSNQQLASSKETYVIVGSNVLYMDILPVVLRQLGYSSLDIISAKATIQMKNWKPLPLDQVTDDKKATVGEVLGDISSFVTLRIVLANSNSVSQVPTEWNETMIRQVVLALTQTMSQLTLSKLCNISQPLISSIVRGGKKLGRRKCMEFGQWYMNYIKSNEARPVTMHREGSGRLVFDKRREIPRLKLWFAENAKPTDELLEEYSRLMNEDPIRKARPPVSAKALKNWWKNERQKLGIRQREIRGRPKLKQLD